MLSTRSRESLGMAPMIKERPSDNGREFAEHLVQGCLLVGTLLALPDDERTRGTVLTSNKSLRAHCRNDHGARRHIALGDHFLGTSHPQSVWMR